MNHRKPTDRKAFEQKAAGSRNTGTRPAGPKATGPQSTSPKSNGPKQDAVNLLTKQEKELLEDCLDELYEDYVTYRDSLKKDEEMNITYKMFMSIVKKLGLRQPK
ncbi:hypothetical protein [Brevibacillus sp. SYSU BS000544]|uniref:hypothetical protein n=1 Tax=Brevibacillus sp. SYSU BS000544 TaxID=3416443 RepID=UPI003CE4C133